MKPLPTLESCKLITEATLSPGNVIRIHEIPRAPETTPWEYKNRFTLTINGEFNAGTKQLREMGWVGNCGGTSKSDALGLMQMWVERAEKISTLKAKEELSRAKGNSLWVNAQKDRIYLETMFLNLWGCKI